MIKAANQSELKSADNILRSRRFETVKIQLSRNRSGDSEESVDAQTATSIFPLQFRVERIVKLRTFLSYLLVSFPLSLD